MITIIFPSNPSDQDTYLSNNVRFVYVSSKAAWIHEVNVNDPSFDRFIQNRTPESAGVLWFNTMNGHVYIMSGTSWVDSGYAVDKFIASSRTRPIRPAYGYIVWELDLGMIAQYNGSGWTYVTPVVVSTTSSGGASSWSELSGIPTWLAHSTLATFEAGHTHPLPNIYESDILDLQNYALVSDLTNYASANHNHDATYSPLNHNHDTVYSLLTHNHDADYLGVNAKAADSELLDGYDSGAFPRKAEIATITAKWDFNSGLTSNTLTDSNGVDFFVSDINGLHFGYTNSFHLFINTTGFYRRSADGIIMHEFYHKGNSNSISYDWAAKNFTLGNNLETFQYASGYGGRGCRIENIGDYRYTLSVDNLIVRRQFSVFELLSNKISATNGALWVSDHMQITTISDNGTNTTCYFDDDTELSLQVEDIVRAQVGGNFYEGIVIAIQSAPSGNIVIQNTAGTPWDGMTLVRVDNTNVSSSRKGAIYLTSSDANSPFIDVIHGQITKSRLGLLDGITDGNFQSAIGGYGLYSDNAYLIGDFVLKSTGNDIETEISTLNDSINLRVAKDSILSQINLSTEGVRISGDRIAIDGSTTFTNGSIVGAALAATTITGDKIATGTITATQINSSSIQGAVVTASYINTLSLNATKGAVGGFSIDTAGFGTNNFYLSSADNKLYLIQNSYPVTSQRIEWVYQNTSNKVASIYGYDDGLSEITSKKFIVSANYIHLTGNYVEASNYLYSNLRVKQDYRTISGSSAITSANLLEYTSYIFNNTSASTQSISLNGAGLGIYAFQGLEVTIINSKNSVGSISVSASSFINTTGSVSNIVIPTGGSIKVQLLDDGGNGDWQIISKNF